MSQTVYRLHERTRRRLCRAAFLLLCVVPTAATGGWCVWRHRPGHAESVARRWADELGHTVSLDAVRYLCPSQTRYEGVQVADPETAKLVLRCGTVEANSLVTEAQGRRRSTLQLRTSQVELEGSPAGQLGRLLDCLLRRSARCSGSPELVELQASQVVLRWNEQTLVLAEVTGQLWTSPAITQVRFSFHPANDEAALDPIRLGIARSRQSQPPVTAFELDTARSQVPCSWLSMAFPGFRALGSKSRFCGYLWGSEVFVEGAPAGCDGYLTGQLLDVDLGQLVSGRFPHRLSGSAHVHINSARICRGRLQQGEGELYAGPGVISRSLLAAAVEHLHLIEGAEPATTADPVPYEQLAVAVRLDGQGMLQLYGRCRGAGLGAILVDRKSRLLSNPVLQPQPVTALLQTLGPAAAWQVPVTPATEWLIHHLPTPAVLSRTALEESHTTAPSSFPP